MSSPRVSNSYLSNNPDFTPRAVNSIAAPGTDETCKKIDNLLKNTAKIAFSTLKDDKLEELKKERELELKQLQEMQEEEDLMIYLLLH